MLRSMGLKQVIERSDTSGGRAFDLVIQGLIVVSLVSFSFETLPALSSEWRHVLQVTEAVLVGVFTLEYALRLWVADDRTRFVFSFFGLVDLAAILPFYLATGLDLRSIRAVRLLRLFRVFKLLRYGEAIARLRRAFVVAREEIVLFVVAAMILLYLAAVGIYYFERGAQPDKFSSIFDGLWWAVASLTTVGYGDVYPVTVGGKIFTFVVLLIGLGIVAVPTGLFASALSRARSLEQAEADGGDAR
jgi:voltage-gated potassium channel